MKKKKNGYDWKFTRLGGVTRVSIERGEDIAHLGELDQKLWTVLSCPVKGLELDEKTLSLMDTDGDGKIRVNEVVAASQWLCQVLRNPDVLLAQKGELSLSEINEATEAGAKVLSSARQILKNLGAEGDTISLAQTADSMAIFANTRFNGDGIITEASSDDATLQQAIAACLASEGSVQDRSGAAGVDATRIDTFYASLAAYRAWKEQEAASLPYGADTEAALAAYKALQGKVADFFMRCKLAAFDEASAATLDMSAARIEAISGQDMTACGEQIAACPLARVNAEGKLPVDGKGINPAWQGVFATLCSLVISKEFGKAKSISEADWNSLAGKFATYEAWMAAKAGAEVEGLGMELIETLLNNDQKAALLELVAQDQALESEAAEIQSVDKLLHLTRDFCTLLRNFVTLSDFYTVDPAVKADFQAGTLYIDQRSCDLCIKVSDMGKHNAMASHSGMYLLYCDCTSKVKNEKMTIVAVVTNGDVNDLVVGKNAIFYDRNGLDWDATVTKIVDNPISIRQAFWSPYRKMGRFIEEQVNKFASSQDSKVTSEATGKIGEAGTKVTESSTEQAQVAAAESKKQAFDIAKFCGIFAAIGMAIGAIGSILLACAQGFLALSWWQMPLAILGIMLLISGPAMIMAWLKLRRRSLSPILNANGWAINAQTLVNIRFGATLTHNAKFPRVSVKDPLADKKNPWWRWLLTLLGFGVAALVIAYYSGHLARWGYPYPPVQEEVVAEAE